jgi:hypothetical protein
MWSRLVAKVTENITTSRAGVSINQISNLIAYEFHFGAEIARRLRVPDVGT